MRDTLHEERLLSDFSRPASEQWLRCELSGRLLEWRLHTSREKSGKSDRLVHA